MLGPEPEGNASPTDFRGWRMVAIAFLSMNFAYGLIFGSYGVLVTAFITDLEAPRVLATAGLSLMILFGGVTGPFMGSLLSRISLRKAMMTGAGIISCGFIALSFAPNIYIVLAIYLVVLGPGYVLISNIACSSLVSRWFVARRGMAMGLVTMPVFLAITPLVVSRFLPAYGMAIIFLLMAALFLVLMLILGRVIDWPEHVGQVALAHVPKSAVSCSARIPTMGALLRDGRFVATCFGVTMMYSVGPMLYPNLVPMMADRGFDLAQASVMFSAMAGAGVLGSVCFGRLADLIGPVRALAIGALIELTLLALFGLPLPYWAMVVVIALIGVCLNGITAMFVSSLAERYGSAAVSRALGLATGLDIAFIAGSGPLAGYMYDRTGNYDATLMIHVTGLVIATILFLVMARTARPSLDHA